MSFYRQSTGSPSTYNQPNYFLSPQPSSSQQSQHLPFQQLHSQQSVPVYFEQPHHHSYSQRKSDGFEPMNTSPTTVPLQLHVQHQSPQYLPSFLTGEHTPSSHNLTAPEPSAVFETQELSKNTTSIAQAKPAGPPISGLGELSGVENSAESFEKSLATANSGQASSSPTNPTSPISSTWVTIFGFPGSATTYVVTNFSQYGTILETKANPGSNWLHLKYSNKIEARRAINRNGTVIGGTMMIGVIPHEELSEDQKQTPVRPAVSTSSVNLTSPVIRENMSMNISRPGSSASRKENQAPLNIREFKNRLRPLSKSSNSSLDSSVSLPQENSGIVARAVEYMFGW